MEGKSMHRTWLQLAALIALTAAAAIAPA